MENKTLFILIGPKGSGKTFIGQLVQKYFGIPFLRVEDIALQVKKERSITDNSYIEEVFAAIETAVRHQLSVQHALIIESTGLTDSFDQMLASLRQNFQVYLIGISTDMDLCLQRVKSRDASMHVDVSDTFVNKINAEVFGKKFTFAGQIENTQSTTEQLIRQVDQLFTNLRYVYQPVK